MAKFANDDDLIPGLGLPSIHGGAWDVDSRWGGVEGLLDLQGAGSGCRVQAQGAGCWGAAAWWQPLCTANKGRQCKRRQPNIPPAKKHIQSHTQNLLLLLLLLCHSLSLTVTHTCRRRDIREVFKVYAEEMVGREVSGAVRHKQQQQQQAGTSQRAVDSRQRQQHQAGVAPGLTHT